MAVAANSGTRPALPESVDRWLRLMTDQARVSELRDALAPDVVMAVMTQQTCGPDAVIAFLEGLPAGMPSAADPDIDLAVLPAGQGETDDRKLTVRMTGPGGTAMPSPGGPVAAVDFSFALDSEGRIAWVSLYPHHTEPADLAAPLVAGAAVPDEPAALRDVDGESHRLVDPEAVSVVVFTSNACPFALGWHERLQRAARDYGPRGVHFVQVNANDATVSPKDGLDTSRARVRAGEFGSPCLVDEGQRVARAWGARHTPEVFVVGAGGRVLYHGAPDGDSEDESLDARWLRDALDAVLAGQAVRQPDTALVGCTIKWTL